MAFLVLALIAATPASAYWSSVGTGVGSGTTGTLSAPTSVTVASVSLPSVSVGWTASAGSPAPTGYYVTRTSGGSTVAACASSASSLITGTSCVDTGMSDGSYTYTVTAKYRSWTAASVPSGSVTVMTPTKVAFTTQPSNTIAGVAISPSVAVTVQTASGAAVPLAGRSVSVAIGTNPGSGTLSGTATTSTNSSGVATFSGLSINKAAAGYTLSATSTGLTSATSGTFTISAATADRFVITSTAVSGTASASATLGPITVERRDALGNPSPAPTGGTAVSLASNSAGTAIFAATSGGSGITTVTIPAGSSSTTFFYGDTKAATPTITVSGALASATQDETITAAAAAKFAITSAAITAGAANITASLGPLTVQRQDQFGNAVTGSALAVTLASNSAGTAVFAATQNGTTTTTVTIPLNASSVNFYYGDTIPGSPTITASGTLASGTQVETIVVGPAAKLAITSGSIAGVASDTALTGPVTVQVRDIANNAVTTGVVVSLSSTAPGTAIFAATSGGTGVTSRTIPSGQSSVSFYYGNTLATTVTVTAAATGLTSATISGAITPAPQSQLVFGQQPTNTAKSATITPAVTARILDRFGNLTASTASVSIAIANNGGAGLLGLGAGNLNGTTTVTAVGGVATFSNLRIDGGVLNIGGEGPGYTLRVSSSTTPAVTSKVSDPFDIT
jgi:hypothetical protein